MRRTNEKRSSTARIQPAPGPVPGVGGRQPNTTPPPEGGRYPDICTRSGPGQGGDDDPRLRELAEIGLGERWMRIAHTIGYDAFVAMWRILAVEHLHCEKPTYSRVRVWVPSYPRLLRQQRDKYIRERAGINPDLKQIQADIEKNLGESLSLTHIQRVINRATMGQ